MKQLARRNSTAISVKLTAAEAQRVYEAWLEKRSERTRGHYLSTLRDFAAFRGLADPQAAATWLVGRPALEAHLVVEEYLRALRGRKLSPGTIGWRLSGLKSITKYARRVGAIDWHLEVEGPKTKRTADVQGPPVDVLRRAFAEVETYEQPWRARLRVLLSTLAETSLRSFEPSTAIVPDDVDLEDGKIRVLRKKRDEKAWWSLSPRGAEALRAWIRARGDWPGPLLVPIDRHGTVGRTPLTSRGVRMIIAELGERIGWPKLSPNRIRHTTNSVAARKARERGYTIDEVMDYTSHKDPRTLMSYMDPRRDAQRELAAIVSEEFDPSEPS